MAAKLRCLYPTMRGKHFLSVLFLFLFTYYASGQTVAGKVTDQNGEALPGVSVLVKNTSTTTSTDASGRYSIPAPPNSTLTFTMIGFKSLEAAVNNRTLVNVQLSEDSKLLNEVMVTALGIKKESKRLGYSATSVTPDELIKNRTTNVMESLEGKVAGLNITPPAAGAGASNQIRLRGQVGFAGANNSPLVVINGLPMEQGSRGNDGNNPSRDRGDNLANVNPDDIESMTVLKGATAAALYGSRAAAGAIIITTKSGQKNQGVGIDLTSSYTSSEALNFMDEIVQTEYGQGQGGAKFTTQGQVQAGGQFGWGAKLDGLPTMNFDGVLRPYSANPNQLFDFLRTGTNLTNTLGFSGGGANGSFRASISTTDAGGIVPNNDYKRNIFNLGINHDVLKNLKLQVNVNFADEDYINPPQIGTQGDGAVNFFNRMPISTPLEAYENSAVNANGAEYKTNGFLGTVNNPYYPLIKGQRFKEDRNRLLGTATLRYNFTNWLYAQGRFNYDRGTNISESNNLNGTGSETLINTADGTYRGNFNFNQTTTTDINADFLVGGNKEFGKYSVDVSVGGNTLRTQWQNTDQLASNFASPGLYSIPNGTVKTQAHNFNRTRINSFYGLAEFGYNDILYLNVTGRNDWFSVLNPENNSKFYPSVSGSFIFSELLKNAGWLSYGKLRASWAEVGSIAGTGPYESVLTYAYNQNQFNGQTIATINGDLAPNQSLQPFTVREKEIGIETRLFKSRLLVDVGAFDKVTTEQVVDVLLSSSSGYARSKQNLASLQNKGIETLIEWEAIQNNNLSWTTSWNNAFLKTEVLEVGDPSGSRLLLDFNSTGNEFLGQIRYTEGLGMNQLYTRTYRTNAKGERVVGNDGRLLGSQGGVGNGYFPVGSAIPKYTGGWNNTITYKNLSLGVHLDYKFGGKVLSSTLLNMTRQGHSKLSLEGRENGLIFPAVYESSGLPNTTSITAANNGLQTFYTDYRNQQIGDPFIFKSDFVKLRNISVSYNLTDLVKKTDLKFMKGLLLSASCRNLAILYKDLPGLDPEAVQSSGDIRAGYENSSLPTTRNYNLSLNVKF